MWSPRSQRHTPVPPTTRDPVAYFGSELIGGPLGRRAQPGSHWWTPVKVLAMLAVGMFALGMVQKAPCYNGGWFSGQTAQYTHACYSDIPHLYYGRGFADGVLPYQRIPERIAEGGMEYLEYPVLTGALMKLAAVFTPDGGSLQEQQQAYWMANAGLLLLCAVVVVVCTALTHRGRPWDGLLVALAPAMALTATINWDLLAVALTSGALLAWSRSRPVLAGVLLGLATAAKLYPVLLLGPLVLLCVRAGRWRAMSGALAGTLAAWLVTNVPVMLLSWDGWIKFYSFSRERPVDFGSVWLVLSQQFDVPLGDVNPLATGLMVLGCAGLAVLTLTAPRRPRLAQLALLVVALFVLTNKVYSPQYVLWLIPLAALARPRWRDFALWQAAEVLYFLGIWLYLAYTGSGDKQQGLPPEGYYLIVMIHLAATVHLCVTVIRDIWRPERDVIRQEGFDDPSGGVLDGAPDRYSWGGGPLPAASPPPLGASAHTAPTAPHN
ncbi:glycosyltransferase 87 family protein [Streptomyces sp. NPDC005438]|uniref:glycosyltransferase family 87 protein n=1 Tax=Streptomyces sp. NPDC005438 TaxID=3156880 RepID=UPI0033B1D124